MNKTIMIGMLVCVAFNYVTADGTGLIHQVQHALRQAEYAVPERQQSLGYFTENYRAQGGWHYTPEFAQLQELVSGNWREVLDSFVEITGDSKIHQLILCASFFSLPQEDVFYCLNRIADLYLSGAVSKLAFVWPIGAYEYCTVPMYRFALNYDDPTVIEVLQKAKTIQPEKNGWCDMVLSGRLKKQFTSYWYFDPSTGTYPNADPELEKTIVRIVICILVTITIGVVAAWRFFKKRRGARNPAPEKTEDGK